MEGKFVLCQDLENQHPHPQPLLFPHPKPPLPQQHRIKMIQIRLSQPFPFPHPHPSPFPHPQQQSRIKRSRQLLFPPKQDEPQDPPQPVAAKSLMLKPPKIYLQFIIFHECQSVRKFVGIPFFIFVV
jgi:hypothetical protein